VEPLAEASNSAGRSILPVLVLDRSSVRSRHKRAASTLSTGMPCFFSLLTAAGVRPSALANSVCFMRLTAGKSTD
jgi:hypothetical protein